jgi:hypothetical protein
VVADAAAAAELAYDKNASNLEFTKTGASLESLEEYGGRPYFLTTLGKVCSNPKLNPKPNPEPNPEPSPKLSPKPSPKPSPKCNPNL